MNTKKFIASALAVMMLAGCGSSSAAASSAAPAAESTEAAASTEAASTEAAATEFQTKELVASGSSALQPLAQTAADMFQEKYKDQGVSLEIQAGGSGKGVKDVGVDMTVDIGNSDVAAEEKIDADAAAKLTDHLVCINVMGAVVNKDLGITDLSTDDLIGIFTGKITNWNEVGGPDETITLYTRPSSSGTRVTFAKYAMNGEEETTGIENDNSGELVEKIANDPSAIGYVSMANIQNNDKVVLVGIDGAEATLDNAYNGTYKVWCYEHMYTRTDDTSDLAQAFVDYMMSDEFAPEIEKMGYGVASKLNDAAKATHAD